MNATRMPVCSPVYAVIALHPLYLCLDKMVESESQFLSPETQQRLRTKIQDYRSKLNPLKEESRGTASPGFVCPFE